MIFWLLAAVFLTLLAALIHGEVRYRRIMYPEPALDDHHLTVWERLPLYDWEAEGHL